MKINKADLKIKKVNKKIVIRYEVKIEKCYRECPFFKSGFEGMSCSHPTFDPPSWDSHIIYHPECDSGFPAKCPLIKELK